MFGWDTPASGSTDGLTMKAFLTTSYKRMPHQLDLAMQQLRLTGKWQDFVNQYTELYKERYSVQPTMVALGQRMLLEVSPKRAAEMLQSVSLLTSSDNVGPAQLVKMFETNDQFIGKQPTTGGSPPHAGQGNTPMDIDAVAAVDLSAGFQLFQAVNHLEATYKVTVASGDVQMAAAIQA